MKRDTEKTKHFSDEVGPSFKREKRFGSTEHLDAASDSSLCNYRRELNRIFFHENKLVPDVDDFWKFVTKFEAIRKRKQESVSPCGNKDFNPIFFS